MPPLTACFRMGIECAGFPRAATVWRISASSVRAAVKRRGRQRAPARYDGHQDESYGQGRRPGLGAQCRGRHAASQRRRAVPDRQRTGERMHSSGAVENRELIGVVRRTRLEPCLYERRLAGEAGAGHDDGAAFPADDTGVNEEVVRRALRDKSSACAASARRIRQPRTSATRFVAAYTRYDGRAPPDAPVEARSGRTREYQAHGLQPRASRTAGPRAGPVRGVEQRPTSTRSPIRTP